MGMYSRLLGRWEGKRTSMGALMASCSFDGSPRLPDQDALAYGGPYMVGESMSERARAFLEGLPHFVAMIELAAEHAEPAFRDVVLDSLEKFFRPLVLGRYFSAYDPKSRGPEDVIEDLCRLRTLVNREVFDTEHETDCVCRRATLGPEGFRDDGAAVAFIRAAVVEKIAEVKRGRARRRTTVLRPLP